MAVGDFSDCLQRLDSLIPASWFRQQNAEISALLAGIAESQSLVYALAQFAGQQTRIISSSDGFLELTALDFFGLRFPRRPGESDASFSNRIILEIFRERVTRKGVIKALTDLTGRVPVFFEPFNGSDTGGYGGPTLAYGGGHVVAPRVAGYGVAAGGYGTGQEGYGVLSQVVSPSPGAGAYGSLSYPYQIFITAFRPSAPIIPNVGGYGSAVGGYGVGALTWADLSNEKNAVSDAEIYSTVANTVAAGITAWVALRD